MPLAGSGSRASAQRSICAVAPAPSRIAGRAAPASRGRACAAAQGCISSTPAWSNTACIGAVAPLVAGWSSSAAATARRALVEAQRRADVAEIRRHRAPAVGHIGRPHPPRQRRHLGEIPVLPRAGHARLAIGEITAQEAVGLGDMHPGQQRRVVGAIGRAVGQRARDPVVDRPHPRDRRVGLRGAAIGGDRDELRGAPQPPGRVLLPIAMVPHARQRAGVQHLRHQRRDAADHHRGEVGVHRPRRPSPARTAPDRRARARSASAPAPTSRWISSRMVSRIAMGDGYVTVAPGATLAKARTMRWLALLALVGTAEPPPAAPAFCRAATPVEATATLSCGFDRATMRYAGKPVVQARCLLRRVGVGGVLGAIVPLPAWIERHVGRRVGIAPAALARYLVRRVSRPRRSAARPIGRSRAPRAGTRRRTS